MTQEYPLTPRRKAPLVSILVVSHNGSSDVASLLWSISRQTYSNYEILIAENGSHDSYHCINLILQGIAASSSAFYVDNKGFAQANNYLAAHAKGEYILLINPDATLDEEALEVLVTNLERDKSSAAACPITYFHGRFVRIELTDLSERELLGIDIAKTLSKNYYKKFFVREGKSLNGGLITPSILTSKIVVDIPAEALSINSDIRIYPILSRGRPLKPGDLEVTIAGCDSTTSAKIYPTFASIQTCNNIQSSTFKIVNNAGSFLCNGNAGDRLYSHLECYSDIKTEHVDAFCGVCVLLRRTILISREVFNPVFFAYYEDSELSHWIRHRLKANIVFNPRAEVYHKHSESTVENSTLWNLLVQRSCLYFQILTEHARTEQTYEESLQYIYNKYDALLGESNRQIGQTLKQLDREFSEGNSSPRRPKRIGIFTAHMSSMGGGERHALGIAAYLCRHSDCEVYLISEIDFDLKRACSYFSIDGSRIKKLISPEFSSWETALFDIFINCSYGSMLIPQANANYYVVSFPSREMGSPPMLSGYEYLHNSIYTKSWAVRYWGPHKNCILYPVISINTGRADQVNHNKEKVILTIGRYNWEGHCKNQHLIVDSFRECKDKKAIDDEWKLVVIGSVNQSSQTSVSHYQYVVAQAIERQDITIIANADDNALRDTLSSASIYIHATGLGKDQWSEPHLHEHYGITIIEAMASGCLPIAYAIGGPAETIKQANLDIDSLVYNNKKELKRKIESCCSLLTKEIENRRNKVFSEMHERARKYLDTMNHANEMVLKHIVGKPNL